MMCNAVTSQNQSWKYIPVLKSSGLMAQQPGKAPCSPLRWFVQSSWTDRKHCFSLQDTFCIHRALLAECRNIEAAMLNRSKHVFALTFFLGQKELLKSSDKKHFSPLEKTMVAYAATSVSVQGIPSVFLAFKWILNYSNILQKNNNETDSIGKTSSSVLIIPLRTTLNLMCQICHILQQQITDEPANVLSALIYNTDLLKMQS